MKPNFPETLPDATLTAIDPEAVGADIDFTPVARTRTRRNGWTPERQRAFIVALAACGSVKAAAKTVGVTARSAYRLCDAPDAESFVGAWDEALDTGLARLHLDSLQRSLEGGYVPIYRRGKLVRVEHRRNDRLAIAVLGGLGERGESVSAMRVTALARRAHRADLAALDEARATRKRQLAAAEAAFRAEVDRLIAGIEAVCAERARR